MRVHDALSDEEKLIEKLRRIEALFAGATTEGERTAAGEALRRIRARLRHVEREDPPVEYRFRIPDPWGRRLFLALLQRYGIPTYRYRGQRRTTVTARVSRRFVEETLWPEYLQFQRTLQGYLNEVTERVIREAVGPVSG